MEIDNDNLNKLLNRQEAAEFLGVKGMTLAKWETLSKKHLNSFDLPLVKIGRLTKYRMKDLIEFIEKRTLKNREKI